MKTAHDGDRVQVHYRIRSQDGSTASSRGRAPLQVTVGVAHPRLPGLGSALVGLAVGERATIRVPPERGYGQPDPARVRRWPRARFPEPQTLQAGQTIPFTNGRGRRRLVRIVRVGSKAVLVDTNHRWAGQTVEIQVKLLTILSPEAGPL